ncbi:MAG: iron ABC transporter permease [Deltaproteobacteria bacterium]|nr:iron ABC transporter permease [Deltaproteobacteria bacterium]MDZ4346497.1 iron ABC transporter permease [Candidatus Binatia bacterium]
MSRKSWNCLLISVSLLVAFSLALSIGPVRISLFEMSATDKVILFNLRLPRILSAFLVGGGLALAGAIFQGLFRNPIADSYLLGVSSGASLGAAAAIVFQLASPLAQFAAVSVFAFIGSLAALALVFYFGHRSGGFSIFRLLLAGLGVGLFLSSLVAILMLLAGEELKALIFFFLGGFSSSNWDTTWISLACIPLAFLTACQFAPELNVLLLGEETAQSSGIRTGRIQLLYAVLAALLTSISVSVAGLIGFVGLIVPHMIRLIYGADHRTLFPLTFFSGGVFLVLCDTAARTIIAPAELPVGIVTSLVGVPIFLYLIRKDAGDYGF